MANRFWVGGNANWDATAGTKWATTSGGAGGAAVPTTADDVFLDNGAGTGNVTIPASTTVSCRSLNCTGYTKILTFAATTSNITCGDGTAGASNVALLFVSGMTLTLTGVGTITCQSTSATQQTITGGTKTLPNITINGAGSSYIAGDALVGTGATFTLSSGTWDNGGFNSSYGLWSITGSVARTWKMSGSAITATSVGNAWNANVTTNLTASDLNSSGSITLSGSGSILGAANFLGGGLTYNSVTCQSIGVSVISGANTYANLTISGGASAASEMRIAATQTVTGTLTLNGNSITNRCCVRSSTLGTQRTISAATVSSNGFIDLMDIIGSGAGTWSNSGWGILNVSGITGATPVTTYWVGGTGNSNDATKYSSSSGGSANTQRAPLLQDTAYYDANSGTGALTFVSYRVGSINFTNTALTSITIGGAFADRFFAGDFILSPSLGLTFGGFADAFLWCGAGTQTITTAGTTFATHSYQFIGIGTYNLGSSMTLSVALSHINGTVNTNDYLMSMINMAGTGGTFNAGASTIKLTAQTAGTIWSHTGTINMGTSVIDCTNVSTNNQTFAGGGKTFYNLLVKTGGSGTLTITGSNTWQGMQAYGGSAKTINVTSATTQILNSNFFFQGFNGALITIQAVTAASAFTLSSSSKITTDYISLKDCTAAGTGNPFYAGAHSTNVSGNTNWTFSNAVQRSNIF